MAPLIATVVVSAILVTLAVSGADDRVHDDYYKQGKMINKRFEAENRARALGIRGRVQFDAPARKVRLRLASEPGNAAVTLAVSHPAEADEDVTVTLDRVASGRYEGPFEGSLSGRRYLVVSSVDEPEWRISSQIDFSDSDQIEFDAFERHSQ